MLRAAPPRGAQPMSSPKDRRKARRRADKAMEEAWEALLEDDHALAEKIARRAILGGEMNPRLWLDLGSILRRCDRIDDAEEALRQAIALAPTLGEAFAELAALQASVGKWTQAARLQQRAVELQPGSETARQLLASYAAMAPERAADAAAPAAAEPFAFGERTTRFDWTAIADELRRHGCARVPGLLSTDECAALRALWPTGCFEHAVVRDGDDDGRVEYRFFQRPVPPLVQRLREEVYARLQPIADEWQGLLERRARFPARLQGFLDQCRDAGQHRTTPILLRYAPGGFNAPHRDVAGRVVFPFQLAVTLGPHDAGAAGGAFRLVDVRSGRRAHEHTIATDAGDGVVFCTTDRLVEIGGAIAAQPVQHGVAECTAERFALGVPFHDHG